LATLFLIITFDKTLAGKFVRPRNMIELSSSLSKELHSRWTCLQNWSHFKLYRAWKKLVKCWKNTPVQLLA